MKAIVLGKHVRRTLFIKPKPSTLCRQMNKLEEQKSLRNLYLFFGPFFLAATPYHVIPCNFLLFFYSSRYSVYSRFFLINLMTTGIGQSKHCIPQPFSRCLITLCSSLFYFNCIFNFFDLSRWCLIQRWATLIGTVLQWFFQALVYIIIICSHVGRKSVTLGSRNKLPYS